MKLMDFLIKIYYEEVLPKKLKYNDKIYYLDKDRMYYYNDNHIELLDDIFSRNRYIGGLNTEIEIIEDDNDIETIEYSVNDCGEISINGFDYDDEQKLQLVEKINELVKKVNKLKNNSQND